MYEDTTWRRLGELLEDFFINSEGMVVMMTPRGEMVVGGVQDGKTPRNVLQFAVRSI